MARKTNEDMLMEDELAAAFLEDDATTMLEPDEPMLSAARKRKRSPNPRKKNKSNHQTRGMMGGKPAMIFLDNSL